MGATTNSMPRRAWRYVWFLVLGWSLVAGKVQAGPKSGEGPGEAADPAYQAYLKAREAWEARSDDPEVGMHFCRAVFVWADQAADSDQRAQRAEEGIQAARRVIELDAQFAGGHYYLAMNLGQMARARKLRALGIVPEMEKALLQAIALNPKFQHAAPNRSLGMLYRDAPGWPASIGSKRKARAHLTQALSLSPDYPENSLELLETFREWGEPEAFMETFASVSRKWPALKEKWAEPGREADWIEWNQRWKALEAHAESIDS